MIYEQSDDWIMEKADRLALALNPPPELSGREKMILHLIAFEDLERPAAEWALQQLPGATNAALEDKMTRDQLCLAASDMLRPQTYREQ